MRSGISELTIIDFGVGVKNDRKIAEWVIGLSRNQRSYNPEMGGRNAPKYALKESLDMYPDTKGDIHEKIEHYEYTLDGASDDVLDGAMERFNTQGRHPRVSLDHALLSLYGWSGG